MDSVWVTVATAANERETIELSLVLAAQGIEHERTVYDGVWVLSVPERQADRARAELADYRREVAADRRAPAPLTVVGRGWPGVFVYASVLMLVAVCVRQDLGGLDWVGIGLMDARRMVAGQWWRAVTALTLHRDLDHLLGNLLFGGFFGFYAARYLGNGLAWGAICASGALGNALNGLLQGPDHRSLGASTAVFGALGLLTAYTWRRRLAPGLPKRVRIAPLIAGLGLLAYTGIGGVNTDVGAHLLGFASGGVFGLVLARCPVPTSARTQAIAAAAACGLVAASWLWGIAAA
jgi:rhomboid protease GluP